MNKRYSGDSSPDKTNSKALACPFSGSRKKSANDVGGRHVEPKWMMRTVVRCDERDWWARVKIRKSFLNEMSIELGIEIQERHSWAKGKWGGHSRLSGCWIYWIPGPPSLLSEMTLGQLSTKQCWLQLSMRRRCSPEAPEDNQEWRCW